MQQTWPGSRHMMMIPGLDCREDLAEACQHDAGRGTIRSASFPGLADTNQGTKEPACLRKAGSSRGRVRYL